MDRLLHFATEQSRIASAVELRPKTGSELPDTDDYLNCIIATALCAAVHHCSAGAVLWQAVMSEGQGADVAREDINALTAGSNRQQQAGPCQICPVTRKFFSMHNDHQPVELPCCGNCISTEGLKQVCIQVQYALESVYVFGLAAASQLSRS